MEWSKKYAEKVLTDSPWAQTQVDTNLTEMFYSPTSPNASAPNRSTRSVEGAVNQEMKLTYHIRFFSARPIRQALARKSEADLQRLLGHCEREITPNVNICPPADYKPEHPDGYCIRCEGFAECSVRYLKMNGVQSDSQAAAFAAEAPASAK